jgi:hypothetical protein
MSDSATSQSQEPPPPSITETSQVPQSAPAPKASSVVNRKFVTGAKILGAIAAAIPLFVGVLTIYKDLTEQKDAPRLIVTATISDYLMPQELTDVIRVSESAKQLATMPRNNERTLPDHGPTDARSSFLSHELPAVLCSPEITYITLTLRNEGTRPAEDVRISFVGDVLGWGGIGLFAVGQVSDARSSETPMPRTLPFDSAIRLAEIPVGAETTLHIWIHGHIREYEDLTVDIGHKTGSERIMLNTPSLGKTLRGCLQIRVLHAPGDVT